jgi:HlyD family secretion protein
VRNAATTTSSVVSYATIIDVNNDDLKLKPGMTANVSVIIAQKSNVLRVGNAALRARIPQEMLPKAPEGSPAAKAAGSSAAAAMTDQERFAKMRKIMADAGIQRGTPATPEQIEKAKKAAKDEGFDDEAITRMTAMMSRSGGQGGPGGGGRRGGAGGGDRQGGGGDRGFTNAVVTRTLYKLVDPANHKIAAVQVRLGISDGVTTEVIDGLAENDEVVTGVTMPGATAPAQGPGGQNPFQQQGRGGFGGGAGGFGGGRGR